MARWQTTPLVMHTHTTEGQESDISNTKQLTKSNLLLNFPRHETRVPNGPCAPRPAGSGCVNPLVSGGALQPFLTRAEFHEYRLSGGSQSGHDLRRGASESLSRGNYGLRRRSL